MMGTGLGVGVDAHRAGPDFLRADAGIVYGGFAVHPRRLRGVRIERRARNDSHAVIFPFRLVLVVVCLGHGDTPSRNLRTARHAQVVWRDYRAAIGRANGNLPTALRGKGQASLLRQAKPDIPVPRSRLGRWYIRSRRDARGARLKPLGPVW
jgi:hypothetical protein